ncbi:hypothetical protein Tco_1302692 [Tanacetum coccineum]
MPKVLSIAWERFGEIKDALTNEQYQQEDIQELMSKLLEDVRNISEELSEYINCPSWNRPIFYDNDDDEYTHLATIPETESDELIKSSVENLVPIPSEFEGISEDTCDVPVCEDSSTFDALSDHSEILSHSNDDDTSSDDDDYEDIEYVSLEESPSLFPIPVEDNDSFFEESDTSLSHLDNSLPEFEPFSDDTDETRNGSKTTHANNSLPEMNPNFSEDSRGFSVVPSTPSFLAFAWHSFGAIR